MKNIDIGVEVIRMIKKQGKNIGSIVAGVEVETGIVVEVETDIEAEVEVETDTEAGVEVEIHIKAKIFKRAKKTSKYGK